MNVIYKYLCFVERIIIVYVVNLLMLLRDYECNL